MKVICAVLGLLTLAGAATDRSAALEQRRDVAEGIGFAIAGVRLGMAPTDVAAALRASGYKLRTSATGSSWEAVVSRRITSSRAGAPLMNGTVVVTQWYQNGDEEIEISYMPVRGGAAVSQVEYYINTRAVGAEAFRKLVHQRYGRPSQLFRLESVYCSPGEVSCNALNSLPTQLPMLKMILGGNRLRLQLTQGNQAQRAYEAAIRTEVERRTPLPARPTF